MSGKDIVMMTLVGPFQLTFAEPILFCLNLYIALIYGLLYIWFESFVIVFVVIYGFNLGEEGLAFVGILIGAMVIMPRFFLYLYFVQEPQFNKNGEKRRETERSSPRNVYRQPSWALSVFQSACFGSDGPVGLQCLGLYQLLGPPGSPLAHSYFSTPSSITWVMPSQTTRRQFLLATILCDPVLVLDFHCLLLRCTTTSESIGQVRRWDS